VLFQWNLFRHYLGKGVETVKDSPLGYTVRYPVDAPIPIWSNMSDLLWSIICDWPYLLEALCTRFHSNNLHKYTYSFPCFLLSYNIFHWSLSIVVTLITSEADKKEGHVSQLSCVVDRNEQHTWCTLIVVIQFFNEKCNLLGGNYNKQPLCSVFTVHLDHFWGSIIIRQWHKLLSRRYKTTEFWRVLSSEIWRCVIQKKLGESIICIEE
jgi:hypothetical protein